MLIVPGYVMNVSEDATEDVVEDVGDAAEIREAAEDETPTLGHGQTVGDYVSLGEAGLKNLQVVHFIIRNLGEVSVKRKFI